MQIMICVAMVVGCVLLDQLTKWLVVQNMWYDPITKAGEQIEFIKGFINWHSARNTGAAWSILEDNRILLVIISVVAVCVLCYLLKDFSLKKRRLYSIALALITAGAAGNMIDRIFRKDGVVDFIETAFMDFPIFNLADSFLTIGTVLFIIYLIFFYKEPPKQMQAAASSTDVLTETEVSENA